MPYTNPLTEAGKEAERQRKRTDIFREAYGGQKAVLRITNQEVSDLLRCSRPTINNWLNDIEKAPFGAVLKLIKIMQIPPETILKIMEVK